MKFLCVVLLVTALIASGIALVPPTVQPAVIPDPICQLDSECSLGCFCYKQAQRQQRGQCVCTMNLNVLNECTEDRECIERNSHRGSIMCSCRRESYGPGQCECVHNLG